MSRLALVLIFIALLTACDKAGPDDGATSTTSTSAGTTAPMKAESPTQVLREYYDALGEHDLEKAYSFVSGPDKSAKPFADYQALADNPVQKKINEGRTFEIGEVTIEGDTARAQVTIQGPDVPKIQQLLLKDHMEGAGQMPPRDKLREEMLKALAAEDVPQLTSRQEVFLVMEEGTWALDFDWDKEHVERELPERERPPSKEAEGKAEESGATNDAGE